MAVNDSFAEIMESGEDSFCIVSRWMLDRQPGLHLEQASMLEVNSTSHRGPRTILCSQRDSTSGAIASRS